MDRPRMLSPPNFMSCSQFRKVHVCKCLGTLCRRDFITIGSLSPPTRCFTAPSFSEMVLTVLLSLSATNKQLQGSSEARERPEGWAKPALWGYALFRFSSFPLPANRRQVPFFKSLEKTIHRWNQHSYMYLI